MILSHTRCEGQRPRAWQGHDCVWPGRRVLSMSRHAGRGGRVDSTLCRIRDRVSHSASPLAAAHPLPYWPRISHLESPLRDVHAAVALTTFPPQQWSAERCCCLVHTFWSPQAFPTSPTPAPLLTLVRSGGLPRHRAWRPALSPFQSRLSREPIKEGPQHSFAFLSFQVAEVGERLCLLPPQTPLLRVPVTSSLGLN